VAALLKLENLTKKFGEVSAVAGIDLEIGEGEFFAMLGPSGSGKTTVLRMIAGFETPTSGKILISGEDISPVPPFERDVNTVFQDYALFPHMTVLANVEYGLKVKGVGKEERKAAAQEALASVALKGYDDRKPSQLSGGQRQRVALARALVNKPKILLLDEPLGALDLKLRHQMQVELKEIQRSAGITFIFVTHDQEEALTMADRIAIFNDGKIVQVGSPKEIYDRPNSAFVAGFVGVSNLLHGETTRNLLGKSGLISIRPEKIFLGSSQERKIKAKVKAITFLGSATRIDFQVGVDQLSLVQPNIEEHLPNLGDEVDISWDSKFEFQINSEG
jgi:putative spermidine/putrescine transport system ATP-binding protein